MWRLLSYCGFSVTFFLLLFMCPTYGAQDATGAAKEGKIFLTSQRSEEIVVLAGEWEFYWHRLLKPDDFLAPSPPHPDGFLRLPGSWNDFRIAGAPVGNQGYATLRLSIDAGWEKRELAIRLFHIASAYKLWIDGRLAATNGIVGQDVKSEVVVLNDRLVKFRSDGQPIELILQVSNFRAKSGGAKMPIEFGPAERLEREFLRATLLSYFLCGGLFIIGIYNIARFLFFQKERALLFFGTLCLLWMVFALTIPGENDWLASHFPGRASEILNRIEWFTYYITLPIGYGFLWALYPRHFSYTALKIISIIAGLFCLEALFAPYEMLTRTSGAAFAGTGALVVYCMYKQISATLEQKNRVGAVLILVGSLCLDFAGVNDMLFDQQVIRTWQLMPLGMFVFALFEAIYLSANSARTYRKIEKLSQELDNKNVSLQIKVAETERLSQQIVTVSEEERCRISQDLHDGICQQLTAARLRFSALKTQMQKTGVAQSEIEDMSALLEKAVNNAYDMSVGLWPMNEGNDKLNESISELCDRAARVSRISIACRATVPECEYQAADLCQQLYRIAQEALTNAIKHSKAKHIQVSLSCSPEEGIRLMVEDDGVGCRAAAPQRGAGLGMRIMAHRAKLIGGERAIRDREGGGTTVSCTVPCAAHTGGNCPCQKERNHA